MRGIILAGGTGSRLWPVTRVTSKQLLPIYDKPLIYYPLSTLMLAGIKDILIITTPEDQADFKKLLGDGSNFGIILRYAIQEEPKGLAQAFIIGEEFLGDDSCMLVLGDNIFHGVGLGRQLQDLDHTQGGHIFTSEVAESSHYGILTLDEAGQPASVEEKPTDSKSKMAITGLYVFDNKVSEIAKKVEPSERGELEITSVIQDYLTRGELLATHLSRGTVWLDTGTPGAMHDASTYIRVIEERTGMKVACLEEIAFDNNWIDKDRVLKFISNNRTNSYNDYLRKIIDYSKTS